jgi:hypothetical protein
MARTGKTAKDIFAVTTEDQVPELETKRGRLAVHDEDWTKVTVVLFNRQIAFLDRLAIDLRLKNGWAASRAEIIRALVDVLEESGLDLEDIRSGGELRDRLTRRLQE